jgi:hypothetical protein
LFYWSYANIREGHVGEYKANLYHARVEERHKRVLAIAAGILVARHLTAEDLFGSLQGSPRTDAIVSSSMNQAV